MAPLLPKPMPPNRVKHVAASLSFSALMVLSVTATNTAATVNSIQAQSNPNGNATAATTPPLMRLGQTAGEEPTTTTVPGR